MPLWRSSMNLLLGPHMFSVHTACEKKFYVWNMTSLTLRMQDINENTDILCIATQDLINQIFRGKHLWSL